MPEPKAVPKAESKAAGAAAEERRAKLRSPNYPSIGLKKALDLTKKVYDFDRMQKVPANIVMANRWGQKTTSSSAMMALAATKAYGLLEVSGGGDKREVSVTESARRILLNATDRPELLKTVALNPSLHKEIWERYGGNLPQDDVLRNYLTVEKHFNEKAVDSFIGQLRDTISFAGLADDDKISEEQDDAREEVPMQEPVQQPQSRGLASQVMPQTPGSRDFVFPLMDGSAVLRVPHPMGQENFEILEAAIKTFKAALVGRAPKDSTD